MPTRGNCRCCQRSDAILANSRVPDGLPSSVRVCGICSRHQGNDPRGWRKRDQDHHDLWAEDAAKLAAQHADDAAALQAVLAAVRAELAYEIAKRPRQVVHVNLDQEIVDEALDQRDASYRSRDAAFAALCEVRLLHRSAGSGRCRCGRPLAMCDTASIVDRYPALEGWERTQWERLGQGRSHRLPLGHPALIDPRWTPSAENERGGRQVG